MMYFNAVCLYFHNRERRLTAEWCDWEKIKDTRINIERDPWRINSYSQGRRGENSELEIILRSPTVIFRYSEQSGGSVVLIMMFYVYLFFSLFSERLTLSKVSCSGSINRKLNFDGISKVNVILFTIVFRSVTKNCWKP